MRMDRKPNAARISGRSKQEIRIAPQPTKDACYLASDPSHPAGKRKEIDNVMKKARQQPANEYWDKKLLEAEEKDPNRWKHSGYKKMYVNGVRKSRSRSPRKTPVSPRPRHIPQSPLKRRLSRTPERYKPRSPLPRYGAREIVKPKEIYRPTKSRPISSERPKVSQLNKK
jgi:NF-kappa-B-activating protein